MICSKGGNNFSPTLPNWKMKTQAVPQTKNISTCFKNKDASSGEFKKDYNKFNNP